MVICENDPLGLAFGVKVFHRVQACGLLRTQLIPLTKEEEYRVSEDLRVDNEIEKYIDENIVF